MKRELFVQRFKEASQCALSVASIYLEETLPEEIVFRVRLNSSYDGNPLHRDEVVFPDDGSYELSRKLRACSLEESVGILWRDGKVPEWINLSVDGVTEERTSVELLSCGRFTENDELLYHEGEGHPPFHVLSPTLPPGWDEGDVFSIYHRSECWTLDDLKQLTNNSRKVWFLELLGSDFDDTSLEVLSDFEALEILHLKHSPIEGVGLAALSSLKNLRVLHIGLEAATTFDIGSLPKLRCLNTLEVKGIPTQSWGCETLQRKAPALDWLTLSGRENLLLVGSCPKSASTVTLGARRILGSYKLPKKLDSLTLHIVEGCREEIESLLNGVKAVDRLSFRGTPVVPGLITELVDRFPLKGLDLVGTGLPDEFARKLEEEHELRVLFDYSGSTTGEA